MKPLNQISVCSGVGPIICSSLEMKLDKFGNYQTHLKPLSGPLTQEQEDAVAQVDILGSAVASEKEIAERLYGKYLVNSYTELLGWDCGTFAGYATSGNFRTNGSSGGLTSWLLAELISSGRVDYIINVGHGKQDSGKLFEYCISSSVEDIQHRSKSRYYPVEMSEVLELVRAVPGRYALVGIPSFVAEIRLLQGVDSLFEERIVYTVGLLCGHQKSTKYAEMLAWQHGILPGSLQDIDFRVKSTSGRASDYKTKIVGNIDGKSVCKLVSNSDLYGTDWGYGLFKAEFSDYIDDLFNETADVVFGDAWLPQFSLDPQGTNIVIVRHPEMLSILKEGHRSGKICIEEVSKDEVLDSQSGMIRHSYDELPYRLHRLSKTNHTIPRTRLQPNPKLPVLRKAVQRLRTEMRSASHRIFFKYAESGDWERFRNDMERYTRSYHFIYRLIRVQVRIKRLVRRPY